MNNLQISSLSVEAKAIIPTLLVTVRYSFSYGREALIGISGELRAADGTMIGQIVECQQSDNKGQYLIPHEDIKNNDGPENSAQTTLVCLLSKAAIEHIEHLRSNAPQQSVHLHFKFRLRRMELPASLLQPKILGLNNPFVGIHIQREELSHTIVQSNWINDFAGPLGIGDFVLIELAIPKNEVPPQWEKVFRHLVKAAVDMREAMIRHDWNQAIIVSREFLESIKFDLRLRERARIKAELKAIFTRQGYSDEAFDNLYLGVLHLFDYASKFVHRIDRGGNYFTKPLANREDAVLMYNLVISILNLLNRKLRE
jgi:hypothetical protein